MGCRFTGGHSRQPWGTGGVWLEPYDESTIEPEIQKLREFWQRVRQEKMDPDAEVPRVSMHGLPMSCCQMLSDTAHSN